MANYEFWSDLKLGQDGERRVAERILKRIQGSKYLGSNHNSAGDLLMEVYGKPTLIEVKTDLMSSQTGNIAIEYESRGKPSDISVSKADVWAFIYCGDKMRLVTLQTLLDAYSDKGFRHVVGGDVGSRTKMFLVPVRTFERWGVEL